MLKAITKISADLKITIRFNECFNTTPPAAKFIVLNPVLKMVAILKKSINIIIVVR